MFSRRRLWPRDDHEEVPLEPRNCPRSLDLPGFLQDDMKASELAPWRLLISSLEMTVEVSDVPIGVGLPTRGELLAYYPAKFTWEQLKTFVNSGQVGILHKQQL